MFYRYTDLNPEKDWLNFTDKEVRYVRKNTVEDYKFLRKIDEEDRYCLGAIEKMVRTLNKEVNS